MRERNRNLGPHDWLVIACLAGTAAAFLNGLLRSEVLSELYVGWLSVSGFFSGVVMLSRILLGEAMKTWCTKLFAVPRLYFLTMFLLFAFTSRAFLGFWFVGIGGWTYEDYVPPGKLISVIEEQSPSGHLAVDKRHEKALASAFSSNMRPGLEQRCWPTRVYLAETLADANQDADKTVVIRLVTPESFGFVFPDYLTGDISRLIDVLNLLWNPSEVSNLHDAVMSGTGWKYWRYPSHAPSNAGFTFYSGERVQSLWLYEMVLCNTPSGEVKSVSVEVINSSWSRSNE